MTKHRYTPRERLIQRVRQFFHWKAGQRNEVLSLAAEHGATRVYETLGLAGKFSFPSEAQAKEFCKALGMSDLRTIAACRRDGRNVVVEGR